MNLSWEDAKDRIRLVDEDLKTAFATFHQCLSDKEKDKATVYHCRYRYGDLLIDSGRAFWPGGEKFPEAYVVAKGLPFGLILTKMCDVIEPSVSTNKNQMVHYNSQALLAQGEFIGLFELLDKYLYNDNGPQPDWTIASGTKNIIPPTNLANSHIKKLIQKNFGLYGWNKSFSFNTFVDDIISSEKINHIIDGWHVDVLLFSKCWFDNLFEMVHFDQMPEETLPLYYYLTKKAWQSVTRIRETRTSLFSYLPIPEAETAYDLLTHLSDCLENRRPIYVPTINEDTAAPIDRLCQMFLAKILPSNEDIFFLAPQYFYQGQVHGFVPLEVISNKFANKRQSTVAVVRAAIEGLAAAYNNMRRDGKSVPSLSSVPDIVNNLVFRAASEEVTGKYEAFQCTLDGKITPVDDNEFFSNVPGALARSNKFFKSCVRVSLGK